MINLRNIENIIYILSLIIAYLIAETVSGWFRAYVAKKVGDDSPEALGYLSFNPLVHIDPIGMLFLIFTGFGWGRAAPLNPDNIENPYRTIKLMGAYFSDAVAHIVIAFAALLLLLYCFGTKMIDNLAQPLLSFLTYHYPGSSSLTLSIGIILIALIYLSVLLAVLNFLINGFRLYILIFYEEAIGLWYIDLVVPILLIIAFADHLQEYTIKGITLTAQYIAPYIGIS